MTRGDPLRLGLAMAAVVIAYAVFVGAIRAGLVPIAGSSFGEIGPTRADLGALWLTVQLALPGVIAAIGSLRRSGPLLVTAGILCLGQSVIAFSGATLPFVVPAVVLIALGGRSPARHPGSHREPVAVLAIIVLAVAAFGVGLGMTETRCWTATKAPDGSLVYADAPDIEADPETGEGGTVLDDITVAAGCDGGVITPTGAGLALLLDGVAVALAWWATLGRRHRDERSQGRRDDDEQRQPEVDVDLT